ncbi:heterokaryon incompatibility protein [Colletotrichum camelliae]|nr:heterokaryon incompatibility protein [Colletotrichum camelliae]
MRRDGIPWDAMPKTFQDAITVCQRLGVYYLWIDSLCIVQDDEQDWRVESAAMASIYENSYFTITAATAWTDEEGFLKERPKCHLSCDVIMGISCRERIRHESNNDWEPIWSRAWCFQERLVPRRLLTFRHSEVTWECRSASWCECGRNETYDNCPDRRTYERNIMNPFVSHSHRIEYWYTSIVEQFTTMSLSFEKDRLPAILAMATQILDRSEDRCLAGIWEADMLQGLLWRCFGRTGIDSIGNETIFFPMSKIGTELQAPSWSWASVEGPITYSLIRESSQRTFDAEILAVDYPKIYQIDYSCVEVRRRSSHIADFSSAFLETHLRLNRALQFRCMTFSIGVIIQSNLVATAA